MSCAADHARSVQRPATSHGFAMEQGWCVKARHLVTSLFRRGTAILINLPSYPPRPWGAKPAIPHVHARIPHSSRPDGKGEVGPIGPVFFAGLQSVSFRTIPQDTLVRFLAFFGITLMHGGPVAYPWRCPGEASSRRRGIRRSPGDGMCVNGHPFSRHVSHRHELPAARDLAAGREQGRSPLRPLRHRSQYSDMV